MKKRYDPNAEFDPNSPQNSKYLPTLAEIKHEEAMEWLRGEHED